MAQYINTNMGSLNAQRSLAMSQSSLQTSLARLSSGLRINSAKDDAAGLAIVNRMTSQINGLSVAQRNANDGISLAQTAEGAMQTITDNLQRMRDLAVQATNASATSSDRVSINNEIQQLSAEIQRVASTTSFNGTNLIDGTFNSQSFQVGANQGETINISSISNMQTSALGASSTTTANGVTTTGTAVLAAGSITLNGVQVGATVAGALNGQSAGSAFAVANAINSVSGASGVSATANATTVNGNTFAAGATASFTLNGVTVAATAASANAAGQGASVAAAINAVTNSTGVTASANATTGALTLTASDGRDITVGTALAGLAAATSHGTVSLSSNSATGITVGGTAAGVAAAGLGAFTSGTVAPTTTFTIASLDTLTAADAAQAITTITGALNTVNSAQGALGAYQNRFQSAVSNLTTITNNLTASRSRIQDTDFAAETANLSRSQILQQAGTAMLAQANSLPNGVLALLR